jgi:phosphate uptake regulator
MAERAKHIRSSFDAALYGLKNDVLMMSSLTDRIFQTAFEALLKGDSELCDHVISEDNRSTFSRSISIKTESVCCFDFTRLHRI